MTQHGASAREAVAVPSAAAVAHAEAEARAEAAVAASGAGQETDGQETDGQEADGRETDGRETGLRIDAAQSTDLPAIHAIYAHHVRAGTGSFEEEPPPMAEMSRRYRAVIGKGLPWLVARDPDSQRVLGYAYAGPYHGRSAYRFTVEDSVYVHPEATGRGIGRQLLQELMRRCAVAGARQMVAVVGDSGNTGSIRLHAGLGFREVGVLRGVGFKLERWLDVVLMQRMLEAPAAALPAPVLREPATSADVPAADVPAADAPAADAPAFAGSPAGSPDEVTP